MALVPNDPHRPIFHVMPKRGWLNDPNGPIYYKGRYHLFFQNIPDSPNWDWRIQWGHVTSQDLVTWKHLKNALKPTEGGFDANGCWSGCCALSTDGVPTILHTGVVLRASTSAKAPPPEFDLGLKMIESQCWATPVPGDDNLETWEKQKNPFLQYPPRNLQLTGWRDPFILQSNNDNDHTKIMILGSGFKNTGGSVLRYKSDNGLTNGWKYDGPLIQHMHSKFGRVWECPVLIALPQEPQESPLDFGIYNETHSMRFHGHLGGVMGNCDASSKIGDVPTHVLLVAVHFPGELVPKYHPVIYWTGWLDDNGEFKPVDLENPGVLDLGRVVYAPNAIVDEKGRTVLWVWMREGGGLDEFGGFGRMDYSGCLSVARVLSIGQNGRLIQKPIPELNELRSRDGIKVDKFEVKNGVSSHVPLTLGHHFDLQINLLRSGACSSGILLPSNIDTNALAIEYNWDTGTMIDQIVDLHEFSEKINHLDELDGNQKHGERVQMRVFVDGSLVEVFLSTGLTLSARFYRGSGKHGVRNGGIYCFSKAGGTIVESIEGRDMETIWKDV